MASRKKRKFRNFSEVPTDVTQAEMQKYLNDGEHETSSLASASVYPSPETNHEPPPSIRIRNARITFPAKLYKILANPKFNHIIRWLPHGRAWEVIDEKLFLQKVAPDFFSFRKYQSFVRQVTGWQFRRTADSEKGHSSYYHELFMRGRPHLIQFMERELPGEKKNKCKVGDYDEPDFYDLNRKFPLPEAYDFAAPEKLFQQPEPQPHYQQPHQYGEGYPNSMSQHFESNDPFQLGSQYHSDQTGHYQHEQTGRYQQVTLSPVLPPASSQAPNSWLHSNLAPSYEAQSAQYAQYMYFNHHYHHTEQGRYPPGQQLHSPPSRMRSHGCINNFNNDDCTYAAAEPLAYSIAPQPSNCEWSYDHACLIARRNHYAQYHDDRHNSQLAAAAILPRRSNQYDDGDLDGEYRASKEKPKPPE